MENKNSVKLDSLKLNEKNKIMKKLDSGQIVIFSATVIKINHVNKHQQRALAVTNKNVLNIASPHSILPNRIKRKIPLHKITGITASRYGHQIVIHVDKEDDYRFSTTNLKIKYIETVIIEIGKITLKPVNFYIYDDLVLDQYTTTIVDLDKHIRKNHKTHPIAVDEQYLKTNVILKSQSKLVFKGQNNQNINSFQEFDIIKVLGRGAFGKVMLCKHEKTGKYYAVKSMRKEDLIQKDTIEKTKTERFLLEKVNNPFLINMEFAFQTKQKIFLVMKFYRGGEMFARLKKQKKFSQQRTKFYAAQVVLALEHLHSLGYVYRDLKPQNILFDTNGYIKISDYGLSKQLKKSQKTHSFTGTASYLSPEVIMSEGHTFTVDWWALGILIYEMLFGAPPFYCRDKRVMFSKIVNRDVHFMKDSNISDECCNLIKGLLSKYPHRRLGNEGSSEIKNHQWFKNMDWEALSDMKMTPEYIPEAISDEDVSNFLDVFTNEVPVDTIISTDHKLLQKFEKQFQDFNFERFQLLQKQGKRFTTNPEFCPVVSAKVESSISTPNFTKKK